MLEQADYIKAFGDVQAIARQLTDATARSIKPGVTERAIADLLERSLQECGLPAQWYPVLVCAGANSGKPMSRRFHLPSDDVVQEDDIIIVDSTPMKKTVWGNWSVTVAVGKDPFYHKLCRDSFMLVSETYDYTKRGAKTVGDIFDFCTAAIKRLNLVSLDPRDDVGHAIFQVPIGQTVDKTPLEDRLFISEEYRDKPIEGILSIEPQVGRVNPDNGITYGAKHQALIIV